MNKHTKGPWVVAAPNKFGAQLDDDLGSHPRIWGPDKSGVADVCARRGLREGTSKEELANAKLIAAAPDGLSAAEDAYLYILQTEGILRIKNQHVLCGLRDFIAKATGRDAEDVQNDFESRAKATGN